MFGYWFWREILGYARRELSRERRRLARLPRYQRTTATLLGRRIEIADACTFLAGMDEIFTRRNYEFPTAAQDPAILDVGANIGLSVIFFKTLHPRARVTAFEPDPDLFALLEHNVRVFGFSDVTLRREAVWTKTGEVEFCAEGAFSGRIPKPGDDQRRIRVPACRLRELLEKEVEFLKLDVEGAEDRILADAADRLDRAARIFVEYHAHVDERQTLHEILAILQRAGFRYHVKDAYVAPKPFLRRPTLMGMDLQLEIYAFRA